MTPLVPVAQIPAAQPAPAPGRGGALQPAHAESFASLLGLEQPGLEPLPSLPQTEAALHEDDAEPDAPVLTTAMPDQQIQLLQPAPPWPPAGLAGLALSAAGGDEGNTPAPIVLANVPVAGASGTTPDLAGMHADGTGDAAMAEDSATPAATFALPQLPSAMPAREAAPIPVLAAPVPTPDVRSDDFSERFGAQLQWMAGQQIGHARIRVSPQELGPVKVLLRLDGERISADFISGHAETRQALEQGLPRLRDLLGEHGFQLAHAGVGDQSASSSGGGGGTPTGMELADDATGAQVTPDEAAPVAVSRGLLDAYA